jgi:hypothetical protein
MSNESKTNPYGLSDAQATALRCIHADAAGVYQCAIRDGNGGAENGHDWKSHRQSIEELEAAFPELLEPISLEDEEDEEDGSGTKPADNAMSDDEWDERFEPAYNPDGTLVEITPESPGWDTLVADKRVWTMLDCDGSLYIAPGVHRVNRMSHHYTKNSWDETTPDVAWDVRDDEGEEA